MNFDRRDFFLGIPGGLAGLALFADVASPQTSPGVGADPEAVNFWVKMGVPPDLLPAPGARRTGPNGSTGLTPGQQESDDEPFFFYYDDQTDTLMPADDIKSDQLDGNHDKGADAKVTFTKKRLRFGEGDQKTYEKYSSSGLYLETQQHPSAPTTNYGTMGWSLLSAILPSVAKAPAAAKGKTTASSSAPTSPPPAAQSKTDTSANAAIAPAPGTQTVLLPNGIGQSALSCFLKDRRQSRFGQFINLLIPPSGMSQPFLPLLTMPAIAQGAMSAVRSIVAGLMTHTAGDTPDGRLVVFQQPPVNIAATKDSPLATDRSALRMRNGTYLIVPKREVDQLSGKYNDYKIYDGYLVGKKVDKPATYAASKETLTGMTYLTLEVKVERTHLGCTNSKA